ncbi:MAG: F0F1 ATP synthase subunit B [Nitrospinota bacterium]
MFNPRFLRPLRAWARPCVALAILLSPAWAFAAAGQEHHNVFDPWMEFLRVLNFLLVLFGLFFLLRKPIRAMMAKRRDGIERAIKEAEEARAEAARLREEYTRRTADLEKELAEIREQAKADQEALRARVLKEGGEAADRIMDQTRFTIEQETRKAEEQIRSRAALLALELAEKALERELSPEDQRRLIRDCIAKVGEKN